jgi:hypothetical protein
MSELENTPKTRGGKRDGAGKKPIHSEDRLEQRAAYLYPRTWRLLEAEARETSIPTTTLLRRIVERAVTPARASDYVAGGSGLLRNTGSGD